MGINIESNIKELPKDLLRTKISWAAHDLDKTINAYANKTQFFLIAKNESKKLEECLNEWAIRKLEEEDLILWARNVQSEYLSVVKKATEINYINYDFSNLNPDSIYEIIKTRRSVRRWKEYPVPPDLIKKIIEVAQWAPSACNRQSCRFIILEDEDQKKALTNLREDWLKFAPVIIFVGADKRNYLKNEIDYVPYMDASMAAQNMLLMAHALGLGAVTVKTTGWEIHERRSDKYINMINNMVSSLQLPEYFIPVSIIALGFTARIPCAPARLPFNSVVHYNKFNQSEESNLFKRYDDKIRHLENIKKHKTNFLKNLIFRISRKLLRFFGIKIIKID